MIDIHWRNTQKLTRFFFMDARAAVGILIFLVHMRSWTLGVACVFMLIFWILERNGLTFDAALRALRCWLFGVKRPANSGFRRRWIDFG